MTNENDPQTVLGLVKELKSAFGSGNRNRHDSSHAVWRPILSETKFPHEIRGQPQ
jgi:hypothetical protein